MSELVFLKLGGSLITDKNRPQALRRDILRQVIAQIASALADRPDLRLLLAHGSGSFGHITGQKHGTRAGVFTPEQWRGYAETSTVASRLNRLVVDALEEAGIPALPLQPSASALCHAGELREMALRPINEALAHALAPVVYGDVALDDAQGGTIISTEEIFRWLAPRLLPQRVILLSEVPGVLSADPRSGERGQLIEMIYPDQAATLAQALGGSQGIDVTGGMLAKVREMIALVECTPSLEKVQVVSGLQPQAVYGVLTQPDLRIGTAIMRRPAAA